MATRTTDDIFSDFSLSFIPNPITGEVTRKTNVEAVKQSVRSLIQTNYYERPFRSDIGCSVRYYLFENWTAITKQMMEQAIQEVIRNFEPRANVLEVLVEDNSEINAVNVTVVFSIRNIPKPVILDVILERVR